MSASTSNSPASPSPTSGGDQSEPVYVKLPPPGHARASRRPSNAPNTLIVALGKALAFVLCLAPAGAAGLIIILLLVHSQLDNQGLLWLWIPMFFFVVGLGAFLWYGLWKEVSGWRGRGDYPH
jgi:hypothetical protein